MSSPLIKYSNKLNNSSPTEIKGNGNKTEVEETREDQLALILELLEKLNDTKNQDYSVNQEYKQSLMLSMVKLSNYFQETLEAGLDIDQFFIELQDKLYVQFFKRGQILRDIKPSKDRFFYLLSGTASEYNAKSLSEIQQELAESQLRAQELKANQSKTRQRSKHIQPQYNSGDLQQVEYGLSPMIKSSYKDILNNNINNNNNNNNKNITPITPKKKMDPSDSYYPPSPTTDEKIKSQPSKSPRMMRVISRSNTNSKEIAEKRNYQSSPKPPPPGLTLLKITQFSQSPPHPTEVKPSGSVSTSRSKRNYNNNKNTGKSGMQQEDLTQIEGKCDQNIYNNNSNIHHHHHNNTQNFFNYNSSQEDQNNNYSTNDSTLNNSDKIFEQLIQTDTAFEKKVIDKNGLKKFKKSHTYTPTEYFCQDFTSYEKKTRFIIANESIITIAINATDVEKILKNLRKQLDQKLELLMQTFPEIREKDLRRILNYFKEKKFYKKESIYKEGDLSNGIYLLSDGTVKLSRLIERGQSRKVYEKDELLFLHNLKCQQVDYPVATISQFQLFGGEQLLLLSDTHQELSYRLFSASTGSQGAFTYFLDSNLFNFLSEQYPEFCDALRNRFKCQLEWRNSRFEEAIKNDQDIILNSIRLPNHLGLKFQNRKKIQNSKSDVQNRKKFLVNLPFQQQQEANQRIIINEQNLNDFDNNSGSQQSKQQQVHLNIPLPRESIMDKKEHQLNLRQSLTHDSQNNQYAFNDQLLNNQQKIQNSYDQNNRLSKLFKQNNDQDRKVDNMHLSSQITKEEQLLTPYFDKSKMSPTKVESLSCSPKKVQLPTSPQQKRASNQQSMNDQAKSQLSTQTNLPRSKSLSNYYNLFQSQPDTTEVAGQYYQRNFARTSLLKKLENQQQVYQKLQKQPLDFVDIKNPLTFKEEKGFLKSSGPSSCIQIQDQEASPRSPLSPKARRNTQSECSSPAQKKKLISVKVENLPLIKRQLAASLTHASKSTSNSPTNKNGELILKKNEGNFESFAHSTQNFPPSLNQTRFKFNQPSFLEMEVDMDAIKERISQFVTPRVVKVYNKICENEENSPTTQQKVGVVKVPKRVQPIKKGSVPMGRVNSLMITTNQNVMKIQGHHRSQSTTDLTKYIIQ